MTAIVNATLIMTDHMIPDATIVIDGGKIVDYGKSRKIDTTGSNLLITRCDRSNVNLRIGVVGHRPAGSCPSDRCYLIPADR